MSDFQGNDQFIILQPTNCCPLWSDQTVDGPWWSRGGESWDVRKLSLLLFLNGGGGGQKVLSVYSVLRRKEVREGGWSKKNSGLQWYLIPAWGHVDPDGGFPNHYF